MSAFCFALFFTAICAGAQKAEAELINCYSCRTVDEAYEKTESELGLRGKNFPDCENPVEQSATVLTDSTTHSCYKAILTAEALNSKTRVHLTLGGIVRNNFTKNGCSTLAKSAKESTTEFYQNKMKLDVENVEVECYECDTDRCNTANSLEAVSVVLFSIILLPIFN